MKTQAWTQRWRRQGFLVLSGFCVMFLSLCFASEVVSYPLEINLESNASAPKFSDITVQNQDMTDTSFVQVTVKKRIVEPSGVVKWIEITPNPINSDVGISWKKSAIPAGAVKLLRVIDFAKNPPKTDEAYEVTITPTIPPFIRKKPVPSHQIHGQLTLVYAYQVLVILRPLNPHAVIHSTRDGDRLTLTNTGNSDALLSHIRSCMPDKTCKPLEPYRLYAQTHWTVEIPKEATLYFTQTVTGSDVSREIARG